MASLLPREGRFFDFFNQHADLALLAAAELKLLLENIGDLDLRRHNIERYEKQADHITHQTISLLHQTFITPLDRDQIHQLITGMDDILDLTEDVAQCLFLYDVRTVPVEARRLADICVACTGKVKDAVAKLRSIGDADAILKICAEIDRLETDADHVMRSAMAKLFREEPDVKEIIKLKEIYQLLETVTDKCEDVANLIEGIVLENA
jgi:hypothetical protein